MQFRLVKLLLSPSRLSLAVVVVATALLIGETNWTYFTYNPGIYDFFYGSQGVVTTLEQSPDALSGVQKGVAENPLLYMGGLVGAAVIVAAVVFLVIRVLEHGFGALRQLREETAETRHEQYRMAIIRGAIFVLWAVYGVFTVVLAVPFCLLLSRIGAEDLTTTSGAINSIGAAVLLVVALHLHVIFARLFCMRPRVFGGEAAIEAAMLGE